MITVPCDQRTEEWFAARRGTPTASQFARIITPAKGELSAQADDYIAELLADIFCPARPSTSPGDYAIVPAAWVGTSAMQNGIATEPEARDWYSQNQNVDVEQIGFCLDDTSRFGCSPDGLVGDEGGLQIKVPGAKTHIKYLMAGTLPNEYAPQVHGELIVTGRAWWDFISYSKDLPPLVVRVTPNEYTAKVRIALDKFWEKFVAAKEGIARRLLES